METCVLIPHELSVILLPHGDDGKLFEMGVTLWANCDLKPGTTFSPDDGELRLDKLEIYSSLSDKDVSIIYIRKVFLQAKQVNLFKLYSPHFAINSTNRGVSRLVYSAPMVGVRKITLVISHGNVLCAILYR